jgi:probable HAF family extracellular repeat protein
MVAGLAATVLLSMIMLINGMRESSATIAWIAHFMKRRKPTMLKLPVLIIVTFGISLSGCGGSGSAATPPPPPANQPPIPDAGADQSVDEGTTVYLSATGADGDGVIVSYSWNQDSGTVVTTTSTNASGMAQCEARSEQNTIINLPYCSAIEFVAPMVAASEDLIFRIFVTDDDGATGSNTVTVTVNDIAPPPQSPNSNFIPLGDLSGGDFSSGASDVSDDGSVVVGGSSSASGGEAFRWISTGGMVGFGELPGGTFASGAAGISADGRVVVGTDNIDGPAIEAWRWTPATGIVGLGDLSGGEYDSQLSDVSADGSVMVGYGSSDTGKEAVLWTSAGGMMGLGYLPGGGAESKAHGVSADGSVVVGYSQADENSNATSEAFIWTQANGMQSLRDVLIAKGVPGLDDWELHVAIGISFDGQWVVGQGINPSGFREAFLANISAP